MEINGVQFDFDPTDYKHIARLEAADKTLRETIKKIESSSFPSTAAVYEAHIESVREFFLQSTTVDVLEGVSSYAGAISALNSFRYQVEDAQKRAPTAYDPRRVR